MTTWEPVEFVPGCGRLDRPGPVLFTPEPTVQETIERERLSAYLDEVPDE